MQRVIDLLHEGNERADILIAQALSRIVFLQLLDQPRGIINPHPQLPVRRTQKGPRQHA